MGLTGCWPTLCISDEERGRGYTQTSLPGTLALQSGEEVKNARTADFVALSSLRTENLLLRGERARSSGKRRRRKERRAVRRKSEKKGGNNRRRGFYLQIPTTLRGHK